MLFDRPCAVELLLVLGERGEAHRFGLGLERLGGLAALEVLALLLGELLGLRQGLRRGGGGGDLGLAKGRCSIGLCENGNGAG